MDLDPYDTANDFLIQDSSEMELMLVWSRKLLNDLRISEITDVLRDLENVKTSG